MNPNAIDVDGFEDAEGITVGEARRIVIAWNHICDEYDDDDGKRVLSR